ncbi:MAG: hypothetical protein IKI23_06970 [Lachnospiraceae bacterium]|nr:hypothetical protein [Lachnospiraceae bacterium]
MFRSPTYGKMGISQIPDRILAFYTGHKKFDAPVSIIIGTDSQNFDQTKMVSVVAVVCEGHGGIFFYEVTRQPLIKDVRTKLHIETNDSLRIAEALVEILEGDRKYEEMFLNCPIIIHVDAGNSVRGKTRALIPELVGWIRACGYDCRTKPESFVASTIADRISK